MAPARHTPPAAPASPVVVRRRHLERLDASRTDASEHRVVRLCARGCSLVYRRLAPCGEQCSHAAAWRMRMVAWPPIARALGVHARPALARHGDGQKTRGSRRGLPGPRCQKTGAESRHRVRPEFGPGRGDTRTRRQSAARSAEVGGAGGAPQAHRLGAMCRGRRGGELRDRVAGRRNRESQVCSRRSALRQVRHVASTFEARGHVARQRSRSLRWPLAWPFCAPTPSAKPSRRPSASTPCRSLRPISRLDPLGAFHCTADSHRVPWDLAFGARGPTG